MKIDFTFDYERTNPTMYRSWLIVPSPIKCSIVTTSWISHGSALAEAIDLWMCDLLIDRDIDPTTIFSRSY